MPVITEKEPLEEAKMAPAYYRLQQELLRKITDGVWKPGERIPPERELAASSGLSIGTVKKAVLNLVQAGYCYRIQGKGSFVSKSSIRDCIKYYKMRNTFQEAEADMSVGHVELVECAAPPQATAALQMEAGVFCLALTRVFMNENKPVIHTVSYLPPQSCTPLWRVDKSEFVSTSLYVLLKRYCGMSTIHCDEILTVLPVTRDAAALLGVQEGIPLLHVSMVAHTPSQSPCEYRESYIRTTDLGLCREHVFSRQAGIGRRPPARLHEP